MTIKIGRSVENQITGGLQNNPDYITKIKSIMGVIGGIIKKNTGFNLYLKPRKLILKRR